MSTQKGSSTATKVVVASTIMLSFISLWRAAAIVLSDLASSAFYVGGIAESAIGRTAPWFILAVMLFGFAVRCVYMESCSMYVRGGVYVVVRDAMGPFMARLSVSALIFDYILTGPISSVSAGQYLAGLLNEMAERFGIGMQVNTADLAVLFALAVTAYFWRSNIRGIHESSSKALRIMQVMTVMVVMFLIWCTITLVTKGPVQMPPAPTPANLQFTEEGAGWLKDTFWIQISFVAIIVAFGHSLLAMSGFETLAQVYREIASPKLKNLKITANIVCVFAVFSTGVITLLAGMIIPDSIRPEYQDNLLGGLATHLAVECAPSRVDDLGGVRNGLGAIVHEPVQTIVVQHVLEKVLLAPSSKHRTRQPVDAVFVVRGQDAGLVASPVTVSHLANPHPVAQACAPLREVQLHRLTMDERHGRGDKLFGVPVVAGELVIRENRDSFLLQLEEKIRRVSRAIKDDGETVSPRMLLQIRSARLVGNIALQLHNDLLTQHDDQSRVDGLGHNEERLAVHGVHPVIGGSTKTEFLSCDVTTRQFGQFAVVHTNVAVDVKNACRVWTCGHPFFGQLAAPALRATGLAAEQL